MVGRVLLLVGCTAAGNYLAARPMRRYRELMDAAQLVGELQSRLQYSLLPAAELLEQLSQEPRFCALPYLRQRRLDRWTHNKTIQKAVESYRITPEQKDELRSLRWKDCAKEEGV